MKVEDYRKSLEIDQVPQISLEVDDYRKSLEVESKKEDVKNHLSLEVSKPSKVSVEVFNPKFSIKVDKND